MPQNSIDHTENLIKIKPDLQYGDDWRKGVLKNTFASYKTLSMGGKIIEPKYTKDIFQLIFKKIYKVGTTPDVRRERLIRLVNSKDIVRILELGPLTGLMIEKLKVKKDNKYHEFDGMWSSSLSDSTIRGKPDNQSVDIQQE